MSKDKTPLTFQESSAHDQSERQSGSSAAAQRQRILSWLVTAPLTTIQARSYLDILHPAGRVMELRKKGYKIQTVWVEDITEAGIFHRVAKYILAKEKRAE